MRGTFVLKDIISCEHNRASTSLINSECFIIACSPKSGSYYGESRRFWGRVCGLLFFPRTMSSLFFGSIWTMAEICAHVKMLQSNEQLHFCVTFLLWNKRFWVRSCPFDPSSVSKWSLYISAFYTSLSNPCDRSSVVTGGQRSWFNEVSCALNKQFCHSCWTTELSPLREIGQPWTSWVFRIVQAVLQLFLLFLCLRWTVWWGD